MSAIFRKTSDGSIEVQTTEDNAPVFIGRTFRMVESQRVDIAQWFAPDECRSWWALRNPCIPMLDNQDKADYFSFHCDRDEEEGSRLVLYPGVVLLYSERLDRSNEVTLINLDGQLLAGSNIFSHGALCLGDGYNPLTVQPVELLLHNTANTDLGWRGNPLCGEWIDGIFHISTWPTIQHLITPPAAIIADIGRLWPT